MLTDYELEELAQNYRDWSLWRRRAVPLLVAAGLLVGGSAPFHANWLH